MDDGVAVSADGDTSSDVDERRILLRHARETIRVLEEQLCAAAVAVADVVATAHSHPIGEFDVLDDDRLSETTEGIPIVFDERMNNTLHIELFFFSLSLFCCRSIF